MAYEADGDIHAVSILYSIKVLYNAIYTNVVRTILLVGHANSHLSCIPSIMPSDYFGALPSSPRPLPASAVAYATLSFYPSLPQ